jgi:probable F420-dependent oxidoreductase
VRVDVAFPTTGPVDVRPAARAAEAAGYDGAWTSEIRHDPLLQLSLAAVETSTITLGTAIALAFARNPMSLAVSTNDLQTLSQGRLVVGLGSQIRAHITRRFSMPWSQPAARMREYVLALRAIWAAWENGTPLAFEGEFYTHTLMTPMFDPGPNPFGPPRVFLAGVGDAMTAAAGEVGDGFLAHGFTTERYLREVTLPTLTAARGGSLEGFDVCGGPFVVTGATEEDFAAAKTAVKAQVAFYASTPAYRAVLELHGWGALGEELHGLTRSDRWSEMGALIDDEVLDAFAVVAEPADVAPQLVARYGDIFTRATLYTPFEHPGDLFDGIAADVRRLSSASAVG